VFCSVRADGYQTHRAATGPADRAESRPSWFRSRVFACRRSATAEVLSASTNEPPATAEVLRKSRRSCLSLHRLAVPINKRQSVHVAQASRLRVSRASRPVILRVAAAGRLRYTLSLALAAKQARRPQRFWLSGTMNARKLSRRNALARTGCWSGRRLWPRGPG